jgi:hypothetical protein
MSRALVGTMLLAIVALAGCRGASPMACQAGEREVRACGTCGLQRRPCDRGRWGAWQACVEPTSCADGSASVPDAVPDDAGAAGAAATGGTAGAAGAGGAGGGAGIDGAAAGGAAGQSVAGAGGGGAVDARDAADVSDLVVTPSDASEAPSDAAGTLDAGVDGPADLPVELPPPPECQDLETSSAACGRCGKKTRTCVGGKWSAYSACGAEGVCTPAATESMACGSSVGACRPGTASRTCTDACTWSPWGACGGATYVAPKAEVCSDGSDDDCNGVADDHCGCKPVGAGGGGSLALNAKVLKLVSDPKRCAVYALLEGSQLVVADADAKAIASTIKLPAAASDVDLSPNGAWLVTSHPSTRQLAVVDAANGRVDHIVSTTGKPWRVEVDDLGRAYYSQDSTDFITHRVSLDLGAASDSEWGSGYQMDMDLSADGTVLFQGESGLSGCQFATYSTAAATSIGLASSFGVDGNYYGTGGDFPWAGRAVHLSPGGQHVWYSTWQLDGKDIRRVRGTTGEEVFTEDVAGTFAIGAGHVWDADLVRPIAATPMPLQGAALMAGDGEAWFAAGGRLYYRAVSELVGNVTLGRRSTTPLPLASYTFTKLLADRTRPRLYALDAALQQVVAIDTATLTPVAAIYVDTAPSALSIDPTGQFLFVGHDGALAFIQIDLATFTFVGNRPTPWSSYELVALSPTRVVTAERDQFTWITLHEATTGQLLAKNPGMQIYEPALAATPDGKFFFAGEPAAQGRLIKYSADLDALTEKANAMQDVSGIQSTRLVAVVGAGDQVFHQQYLCSGTTSAMIYAAAQPIVSVTPDGRLATSSTSVFRVSDGVRLGALPVSSAVQTPSADSKGLYVATAGALSRVDLSAF